MMTISKRNNTRTITYLNLLAVFTMFFIVFTATTKAQSTDLDHSTPMTTNEVKGRWQTGKAVSYFYSFEAGPGEVMVMFDFKPDRSLLNVSAELTDVFGRGIGNQDDSLKRSVLSYFATPEGERLVGRYELKRRQKLVARISIEGDEVETPGSYKIRVSGDGLAFSENNSSSSNNSSNNTGVDKNMILPKNGKLRLLMDDGTIQEINLSRVKEATIKP